LVHARGHTFMSSSPDPSLILCLTFTKAGAAEMADQIHRRLAYWCAFIFEVRSEPSAPGISVSVA
jgi:ATP-dependent exoDNAse (exonuclease V) beta subunit